MRGHAALLLLGLFLVPGTQAIAIGPAHTLSEFPAQLAPPARGDGFTAWIDVRSGVPQVLLAWDDGDTVRLAERQNVAMQHVAAWGDWIAWSQQDTAGVLPGEQAGRTNWDLIVYHVPRAAVVFDSASARSNETNPALAEGRIAYLDDATGVRQVMVAPLSGAGAFQGEPLRPAAQRQGPPALDGGATVFLQDADSGDELLLVREGEATALAVATPGVGLGPPAAWDGRVAWPEYRGAQSHLSVWQGGAVSNVSWAGGTVLQAVGDGPVTVAEVREQSKALWAWCDGEAPQRLAPGIQSRPAVGHGAVAYLVQVGTEQHVQARTVSCGEEGGAASRGAPGAGVAVVALALLFGLAVTRRR